MRFFATPLFTSTILPITSTLLPTRLRHASYSVAERTSYAPMYPGRSFPSATLPVSTTLAGGDGMFRPAMKSARDGAFCIGDAQIAAKALAFGAKIDFEASSAKPGDEPGSMKSFARNTIASISELVFPHIEGSVRKASIDSHSEINEKRSRVESNGLALLRPGC
ncbi:hypothetical protein DF052_08830 [Burkholderia glumae]|nr:hypothetical protein Y5A_003920 [Burkholderia glumae AU6208]RQZ74562.1 hypothetical protein DF052_08830 [Burkholderia glumae]